MRLRLAEVALFDLYISSSASTLRITFAMRSLSTILIGWLLLIQPAVSQSLSIATWTIELPTPGPGTNGTNRAAEIDPFLRRAAGTLKPLNADVVILHGVPDRATARQLVGLLRPRVYHAPIHSTFKRNNSPGAELVEPPITILSRKQASANRSIEWRAAGQIDSPGGFSFAVFHFGTNSLFVYTAQFPKGSQAMTPKEEAALARKRGLCARYLLSHINWLSETATNATQMAYLAADLDLDSTSTTNDPALRTLLEGGFKPSSGNRTLVAATAFSSTGWPPPGALTAAFVRNAEFPGDPQAISRKPFFAPVALAEIGPERPLPIVNLAPILPAQGYPATNLSLSLGQTSLTGWDGKMLAILGLSGALVLLAMLVLLLRTQLRLPQRSVAVAVRNPGPALDSPDALDSGAPRLALPHKRDEAKSIRSGFPAHRLAHGSASDASAGEEEPLETEARSLPWLQLVRERLVRWLAADRSQLLSSHHAGAEQVMELEERLTRIRDQFEARLRAREERITELEAELMAKEKMITNLQHVLASRDPGQP